MLRLLLFVLLGTQALIQLMAQTYVSPKLGGGQVAANMVHIDLYYDESANEFHAQVDATYGVPVLRALEPDAAFAPDTAYAVLNGKAYNAQYGWNAGGFFNLPPGAAIWIEQLEASPALETYEGSGQKSDYQAIFGTAGSPRLWRWSGVMMHNTYAVRYPVTERVLASYHVFFGDEITGSRQGFERYGDVQIQLEWDVESVMSPTTFEFGAAGSTNPAPLQFLNAASYVTNSDNVINLLSTNADAGSGPFEGTFSLLSLPATFIHGGPATNHAAVGSCLEMQVVSLSGPPGARLELWDTNAPQTAFVISTGESAGTNRFRVSASSGMHRQDPFGIMRAGRIRASQPGLYCLGFKLVDASTNGVGGAPLHLDSDRYSIYLQAGITIASILRQAQSSTVEVAAEPGRWYYLEATSVVGPGAVWNTIAGPLPGTNRLQRFKDLAEAQDQRIYRLRSEPMTLAVP